VGVGGGGVLGGGGGGGGWVAKCQWDTAIVQSILHLRIKVIKDNCWEINSFLLRFQCKIRR